MNIKEMFDNMSQEEKAEMLKCFEEEKQEEEKRKRYENKNKLIDMIKNDLNFDIIDSIDFVLSEVKKEVNGGLTGTYITVKYLDEINLDGTNLIKEAENIDNYCIEIMQDGYTGLFKVLQFFTSERGLKSTVAFDEEKELEVIDRIIKRIEEVC